MLAALATLLWVLVGVPQTVQPHAQRVRINYKLLDQAVIDRRLGEYQGSNLSREKTLKAMFAEAGCPAAELSEQKVKHEKSPNVICTLSGASAASIVVGAHFDYVPAGEGVVDNWSGASLLPSLLQSLAGTPRSHTYIFVGFCCEELGEIGSASYLHSLNAEERSLIAAMVNLDTIGLSPTKVWLSHADPKLAAGLDEVARALRLPLGVVNVEQVGSTDSEQFRRKKIPAITIHSLTQQTWPILHSPRDTMSAVNLADDYQTYRLVAAYLAFLDSQAPAPEAGRVGRRP